MPLVSSRGLSCLPWAQSLNIWTSRKGQTALVAPPVRLAEARTMQIDAATRRNLELTHAMSGGRSGSLLATIDRTVTSGGARLLE